MLCQVILVAALLAVLKTFVVVVADEDGSSSQQWETALQERLFGIQCGKCEDMGVFKTEYCCKTEIKCCPAEKAGYCPHEEGCAKIGVFELRTWCLFDNECPGNEKCCGQSVPKCCKNNGEITPQSAITNPIQSINNYLQAAPHNIENKVKNALNPLHLMNELTQNPLVKILNNPLNPLNYFKNK